MTAGYSRYRVLRLEYFEFCDAWEAERFNYRGGWVPMRLITSTGLTMYELRKAGWIEIEDDCARPSRWP